jgi:hypothetical protein
MGLPGIIALPLPSGAHGGHLVGSTAVQRRAQYETNPGAESLMAEKPAGHLMMRLCATQTSLGNEL